MSCLALAMAVCQALHLSAVPRMLQAPVSGCLGLACLSSAAKQSHFVHASLADSCLVLDEAIRQMLTTEGGVPIEMDQCCQCQGAQHGGWAFRELAEAAMLLA